MIFYVIDNEGNMIGSSEQGVSFDNNNDQVPSTNCSNPVIANASAELIDRGLLKENSGVDGELLLLDGVEVVDEDGNVSTNMYWVQSLKVHDQYNLTWHSIMIEKVPCVRCRVSRCAMRASNI